METISYYKLFLLFCICLSQYNEAAFESTSGIRCMDKERQALLKFKQGLEDDHALLSSWSSREESKECCRWWGVKCSNITDRVISLDLHGDWPSVLRGELSDSLTDLQHLVYLDLSSNNFRQSQIVKVIGSLSKLKYLNLASAGLSGVIPHQLGNNTNLETLDLGFNDLTTTNLDWLSRLQRLNRLDMSGTYINATNWLQVVANLPFLEKLQLRECGLGRFTPSSLVFPNSSFVSLSILDLSRNDLTSFPTWIFNISKTLVSIDISSNAIKGHIPDAFGGMIYLEDVDMAANNLEGGIPHSFLNVSRLRALALPRNYLREAFSSMLKKLSKDAEKTLEILVLYGNQFFGPLTDLTRFSSLRVLYLKENHLNGTLPENYGQLSKLETLDLSSNFLKGTLSEFHFSRLFKLKYLDLSFNSFILNMSSTWVPKFQLDVISLANCSMGPHFPQWIQTQNNFSRLDLSFNSISDTLPHWFWNLSPKLQFLNLSYNQINGRLPELSNKFHGYPTIDLSSNNFSGPILSIPQNLMSLHLYKNLFVGSASFLCDRLNDIFISLDLSNNQFSGDLPNCWMNMPILSIVNLGSNNFSGQIPASFGFLSELETLHLRNNSLVGKIPSSLKNCKKLKVIDIGGNKLRGNIPSWIGMHLTDLVILSLPSNQFNGNIPKDICYLSHIQILDMSHNNLSGEIPHCLYNLTALVQKNSSAGNVKVDSFRYADGSLYQYIANLFVQWKGQESEYKKILGYLKVIDLSSNKLDGQIPQEIATLKGLLSLNLSANYLTGNIIEHVGEMESLQSLDLSKNQLSGEIPISLASLTSIGVLDLSYNHLSGKIPVSTQLQSFNASSYIGNSELCGLPLKECPMDVVQPHFDDVEDTLINKELYMPLGLGFLCGLWGVFIVLLKGSWRNAYFRFLKNAYDWFFVLFHVNMARLVRMLNR